MFENYEMAGVYIAIQAVLTLYAQGNILLYSRLNISYKNIFEQKINSAQFSTDSQLAEIFTLNKVRL